MSTHIYNRAEIEEILASTDNETLAMISVALKAAEKKAKAAAKAAKPSMLKRMRKSLAAFIAPKEMVSVQATA